MERDQVKRKKRKKPNSSQKRRPPETKNQTKKQKQRKKRTTDNPLTEKSKSTPRKKSQKLDNSRGRASKAQNNSNSNLRKKQTKKTPPNIFEEKFKPILRSVLNIAFYVFIIVVVFTAIMFTFNDDQTKSFFGYRIMTVKTNSMAPKKDTTYKDGFKAGALIILKKEDKNNLKVGDIITYMPSLSKSTAYLTHRVIEVKDELNGEPGRYYVTKGDFNDVADSPISADQYVGTVIYSAAQVGAIIQFIQTNVFVVLLLALAVFCFYVTLRYYLSMPN